MMRSVYEIFDTTNKLYEQQGKQAAIDFIRDVNCVLVESMLRGAFDPAIKWLLPKTPPPYKESFSIDLEGIFFHECRKLYLFIEGGSPNLKQTKREQLFIDMLEMIDKNDAKLLLSVVNKKFPFKNIDRFFVNEAFPGILSGIVNEQ